METAWEADGLMPSTPTTDTLRKTIGPTWAATTTTETETSTLDLVNMDSIKTLVD